MVKTFVTNGVVSKGYDGAEAIRVNEGKTVATFQVGVSKYDKRAEGNRRWVNFQCKVVGERNVANLLAMKVGANAHNNISGELDVESWTNKEGKTMKTTVIIVDNNGIEYAASRPASDNKQPAATANAPAADAAPGGFVVDDEDDLPFN